MPNIQCVYVEETDKFQVSLRRYRSSYKDDGGKCSGPYGYHNADVIIEKHATGHAGSSGGDNHDHSDPRWPKTCSCGYVFLDTDEWQWNVNRIYEDKEKKVSAPLRDLPVGAMYNADWMPAQWQGFDGMSIVVITPGGQWNIDSRASNCTMKEDSVHRCWIRHGTPPNLTVDKNGPTCAAGAGSIICGNYHGFLRNGMLVDA